MLFCFLIGLSIGIEAGTNQPFVGFEDLNAGVVFRGFISRHCGFYNANLSVEGSFYQGKNLAYSLSAYGIIFEVNKAHWRFSPFLELGMVYVAREHNKNVESGIALDYTTGFLINFKTGSVAIYPKFYYNGLTDLRKHAGFVGIRLGIGSVL